MQQLRVIQILDILNTNSVPIKVLCEDGNIYFAKTIFKTHPPLTDIINELIGNYIYKCWGISVPEVCILQLDDDMLKRYISKNNLRLSYSKYNTQDLCFIGFKEVESVIELEFHNLVLGSKHDYNKFLNPVCFLEISFLDIWLGNKDRRINNPNLLLTSSEGKFNFVAIDHTQLFSNQHDYKGLRVGLMDFEQQNMLINSVFAKKIRKFADDELLSLLIENITVKLNQTLDHLPDFLVTIPTNLGLSKAGREKVFSVLANSQRNEKIIKNFKNIK